MSFKQHLEMISLNESPSKKARFWQSFVRSLKGSDDLRASDSYSSKPRGIFRPISDLPELSGGWPYGKSIYDDPSAAAERIHVPGYRYDPLHRDTYGYSPRAIFPHNYGSLDRYRPADLKGREPSQWPSNDFGTTYPYSRYSLYLVYGKNKRPPPPGADRHEPLGSRLDRLGRSSPSRPSNETFHVTKPRALDSDALWRDHVDRVKGRDPTQWPSSIFHTTYPFSRYPLYLVYSKRPPPAADKYDPHRSWLDHLDRLAELDKIYPSLWPLTGSKLSPTPIKPSRYSPRPSEVAFNYAGQPIWSPSKNLFNDLLNPSPSLPLSAVTRDPFWWDSPLKPASIHNPWGKSPFYLRDSYLSPVKRTFLWDKHPIRPFAAVY